MKINIEIDECKEHDWVIVEDYYALSKIVIEQDRKGKAIAKTESNYMPVIVVICTKCYELRFFSERMIHKQ